MVEQATKDFVSYMEEVVARRRKAPGDDLVSAMLEASEGGDSLSESEVVATSILTLNATHEATVHAIGNSLIALARNPAQYRRLTTGEVAISTAFDELLRFDSLLQMFERWVLEDVEIGGHFLAKGSKVGLLFGAANHDPDVFKHPKALNLDRSPNPHVTFEAGLHYCVGAPLAKVELEAALGTWAKRVRGFDLVEADDRIESLVFRGVGRLQLSLA